MRTEAAVSHYKDTSEDKEQLWICLIWAFRDVQKSSTGEIKDKKIEFVKVTSFQRNVSDFRGTSEQTVWREIWWNVKPAWRKHRPNDSHPKPTHIRQFISRSYLKHIKIHFLWSNTMNTAANNLCITTLDGKAAKKLKSLDDFVGSISQAAPHFPPGIAFLNSFISADMLSAVWLELSSHMYRSPELI